MKITSATMSTLWQAMRVLTDEDGNSGQYMRECSRTTGTPYTLSEIFHALDVAKFTEEAFQDKFWVCFQATHLSMQEDAARANAREAFRGYHLKVQRETGAKHAIEILDERFENLEKKGLL
jgi:hypothetical protein